MKVIDSHRPGDKVRIKRVAGETANVGGIIQGIDGGEALIIRVAETGELRRATPSGVTNFSLAARKAWRNMPDRHVGRPKGSKVCDRVSVTVRLNRELWQRFRSAEEQGLILDRTSAINQWIESKLQELLRTTARAS